VAERRKSRGSGRRDRTTTKGRKRKEREKFARSAWLTKKEKKGYLGVVRPFGKKE